MELVDEQQDLAFACLDLAEDRLEPLLKFAPVLGACHQGSHIQGEDGFVLKVPGHVAPDDPLGQALHNGGLAHAGLANETGIVLALPGENPDHVPDLLVTADDGIGLFLPGLLHQVRAVLVQGVVGALRVVGGDPGAAPDRLEGPQGGFAVDAVGVKELFHPGIGLGDQAQEHVLHRDEIVLHASGDLLGFVEGSVHIPVDVDLVRLPTGAGDGGQLGDELLGCGDDRGDGDAHLGQKLGDQTVLLHEKGQKHMALLDLLIVVLCGNALGKLHGLHGFLGEFLYIHSVHSFPLGTRFSTRTLRVLILFVPIIPPERPFVNRVSVNHL